MFPATLIGADTAALDPAQISPWHARLPAHEARRLFDSRSQRASLTYLTSAFDIDRPVLPLIGSRGTGKSLVARILAYYADASTIVTLFTPPPATALIFLSRAVRGLEAVSDGPLPPTVVSRDDLRDTLYRALPALDRAGLRALLVLDDAHRLPVEVLDELRLLVGRLEYPSSSLRVVLLGPAGLTETIGGHQLRDYAMPACHLLPLEEDEVEPFVERRWAAADERGPRRDFAAPAMRAIESLTGGNPAAINALCKGALERTDAHQPVSPAAVVAAARDVQLPVPLAMWIDVRKVQLAMAAALLAVAVGVSVQQGVGPFSKGPAVRVRSDRQPDRPPATLPEPATGMAESAAPAAPRQAAPASRQAGPARPPAMPDRPPTRKEVAALNADMARQSAADRPTATSGAEVSDLLPRANQLAEQADVKALLQLRAEVAGRRTSAASPRQIESALQVVDASLETARRRRLEIDRQRFAASASVSPTP